MKKEDIIVDSRRLYNDLAWTWQLFCPNQEYVEETETFSKTIREHAVTPVHTLLHMGCGAGGNDFTLKKYFKVTGADISENMLAQARKINPENEYLTGDMRSLRLDRTFDAVTILDAIDYNRTQEDIRATLETVYHHLKPGGIFLTVIEYDPATFQQNNTTVATAKKDDIDITFIENNYDPDPSDTSFEATFIYIIRRNGKQEIHTDHHLIGIFPIKIWVDILKETGFQVKQLKFEHSDFEPGVSLPMLVGIKPLTV